MIVVVVAALAVGQTPLSLLAGEVAATMIALNSKYLTRQRNLVMMERMRLYQLKSKKLASLDPETAYLPT